MAYTLLTSTDQNFSGDLVRNLVSFCYFHYLFRGTSSVQIIPKHVLFNKLESSILKGKKKGERTAFQQTLPMEDVNLFDNELDVGLSFRLNLSTF